MGKFNPVNERIKHRYLAFLSDAKRLSEDSVDQVASALTDFETSTSFREFGQYRPEQAQSYKRRLAKATNSATGRPLAKATVSSRLAALKAFFQWLAQQPGFRSRLVYSDAEYFNASASDERIAKAVRERPVPSIAQIRHVLASMPASTDIDRRNRALIAFTLLSGARDNAIASLSLKHINLATRTVHQDAREVRTKNSKTFTSTFFPVGGDIEMIVAQWINYLETECLWGPDDPLFPATEVALGASGHFENAGLARKHWKNAAAIRAIFKNAFPRAGLPYFNPHSFRNTLATLGEKICPTPEAFKAWSQNLGHSHVLTTFTSYGAVAASRQTEILTGLAAAPEMERDRPAVFTLDPYQMNKLLQHIEAAAGQKAAKSIPEVQ
ncbi:MAG: site-specific integrase [Legionella sp.]|nr:site-specific integrase [Legionella sp.]